VLRKLLENHVLANATFAVVLLVGILSYLQLPRAQDPDVNFNWISIITVLPGASSEDVEKLVTDPLEEAIQKVQDIKFVASTSREGISDVLVRFEDISERVFDKRINDLRREIQNKANNELPDEAEDPTILEITTSNNFPTATLIVAGEANDELLRKTALNVRKDLQRIKGVDNVNEAGFAEPELRVTFDPAKLRARGLSPSQITQTVQAYFKDVVAGDMKVGSEAWLVRVIGTDAEPGYLASLPVIGTEGETTIGDVAQVNWSHADFSKLSSINGRPGVTLAVTKQAQANIMDLVERINLYIEKKNPLLKQHGLEIILLDDQTETTREAINIMEGNALLGLILVMVVTWVFLGGYIAFFIGIGIPFTLAATFWLLNGVDQTLNQNVLLGVVIVLGMLVDDAVVVVEAIYYRIQRGAEAMQAAIDSLKEVFTPVTASVSTTMAAFLPLMLLPGIVGKFMFVVPFVVSVALAISLLEAYWMLPVHISMVNLGQEHRSKYQYYKELLQNTYKELHQLIINKNFIKIFLRHPIKTAAQIRNGIYHLASYSVKLAFAKIKDVLAIIENHFQPRRIKLTHQLRIKYSKALIKVLRHPRRSLNFLFGLFLLAIAIIAGGLVRMEFFAFDPMRAFYINVEMPPGTPLQTTLDTVAEIETKARKHLHPEEMRTVSSAAGQMFTDTAPFFGDIYGQVFVSLNPKTEDTRSVVDIIEDMRTDITNTAGPRSITLFKLSKGPPVTKPISVKVRGDSFDELRRATNALEGILRNISAVTDISDNDSPGKHELKLRLDTDAVQRSGLNAADVANTVRLLFDGNVVAYLQHEGERVEVRVQAVQQSLDSIDQLLETPIALPTGSEMPLGQLVVVDTGLSRSNIRHYNFRRSITVEADLDKTVMDTLKANTIVKQEWSKIHPQFPDVDLDFTGELEDIQESLDSMLVLFLFGIGLIYLILGTQFRSYWQPFMILVTVPLAFTGVTFGLAATGNPLSLFTLYGVVALAGIAVNAAIVMIDAANRRMDAGMSVLHATIYAARRRVVPIIITSLTTIAGLFSLAAGLAGESLVWGPVASSIVWGLAFSTILTLFVIPLLYRNFMGRRP